MLNRARVHLLLSMSIGVMVCYLDRVNVAHAMVPLAAELNLSIGEQSVVLSAFSWGYVAFMPIGGWLADRFGPSRVIWVSAIVWSAATLWCGFAYSFAVLVIARVAVGLGEAPVFPANARIVRDRFRLDQRARATAVFDAGSYVGLALAAPVVVYVVVAYGWRQSFLVCAVVGFVWAATWLTQVQRLRDAPLTNTHPSRTESIVSALRMLSHRKILGASLGFFCYNYSKSFFLTWFPTYLVRERGFTILSVGYIAVVPPLCAIIGELCVGLLIDRLLTRGWSTTMARKVPLCATMLLASTIGFTQFIDSPLLMLAVVSFSFAAVVSASPAVWTIPGDIAPAPDYVGVVGGLQNTFSNVAGIVAPLVTGLVVSHSGGFGAAFIITGLVCIGGAASYWFLVGELVPMRPWPIARSPQR